MFDVCMYVCTCQLDFRINNLYIFCPKMSEMQNWTTSNIWNYVQRFCSPILTLKGPAHSKDENFYILAPAQTKRMQPF